MRRGWAVAAGLSVFVFAAVYIDVVWRARSAYMEGEKWLAWDAHPELKKAHFDAEFAAHRRALERRRAAGRLSAADFEKQMALATFERDQAVAESPLKYAYVWFQSAAELFTPPETRWTALARARMAETRVRWKRELDTKRIPYQDYMLE